MTEKTFEKHRIVIDEYFANGFNGTKAYSKHYPDAEYKSADASFRAILENTRIQDYVREKETATANKAQMTFENNLNKLEDLRVKAEDSGRFNDAINAIKEQNKMLGHYKENNNQKAQTNISFDYPQININYNSKKLSLSTD